MEFLNHHIDQAFVPRITKKRSKIQIAKAALKHIPGSQQLIEKTFESKPVPRELPIEKAIDLVFHTGFIQH